MKLIGILLALVGWLLPVISLSWTTSTPLRLTFCLAGMAIASIGILKVLNGQYLKNAIWKR